MKPLGSIPVPWCRRIDDVRFRLGPALVFGIGLTAVVFSWPQYDKVPSREAAQNFYSQSAAELTATSVTQQNLIQFGQLD